MMKRLDPRLRSLSPTTNRDAHLTPIIRIYVSRSAGCNAINTSDFEDSQRYMIDPRGTLQAVFFPSNVHVCTKGARGTQRNENAKPRNYVTQRKIRGDVVLGSNKKEFLLRRSRGRFSTCVSFTLYAKFSVTVAPIPCGH